MCVPCCAAHPGWATPARASRSGLDLSIVSAIAKAHGGRAEVGSTAGGGATSRLVLPLAGAAAAPAAGTS